MAPYIIIGVFLIMVIIAIPIILKFLKYVVWPAIKIACAFIVMWVSLGIFLFIASNAANMYVQRQEAQAHAQAQIQTVHMQENITQSE